MELLKDGETPEIQGMDCYETQSLTLMSFLGSARQLRHRGVESREEG
jgi:hypothetical protein